MNTGLDPITVAEAGPIMAEALGHRWPDDRPEVLKYVNKYRQLLYTMYDKFKLFDNVFHCICVSEFPELCTGCGESSYQGVTLPNDVLSVEGVWSYGQPLVIHSRWRETHTGMSNTGPRVNATEMAEKFCTERDLKKVCKIRMFTEREEDAGKLVHIDVISKSNRPQRIVMTLVGDGWAISPVPVRKIISVSLPAGRVGWVRLAQNDGYDLSIYAPWESVPSYRRLKLPATCCKGTVIVQGVKKFQKICFDHEVVEVGNDLIIEAAARYFKYGETTTETAEINRAMFDKSQLAELLNGLIARHRGNAIQDASPFRPSIRRRNKPLPGYRK